MENMEMNFLLFWIPLMMTGVLIVLIISWFDHRTRRKGLELLRAYAERGEDPPESMVEALAAISAWGHQTPVSINDMLFKFWFCHAIFARPPMIA